MASRRSRGPIDNILFGARASMACRNANHSVVFRILRVFRIIVDDMAGCIISVTPFTIGVRANIHLGGQTEFCPNGENNLFVTRPRQGEKIIMNYCSVFLTVVDRYPRRLYPRTSPLLPHPKCISGRWILVPFGVTQLVKQMCCLLPEYVVFCPNKCHVSARIGGSAPPDPPSRTPMPFTDLG